MTCDAVLNAVWACCVYVVSYSTFIHASHAQNLPTTIQSLHVQGDRIYVGDLCEAFHLVQYKRQTKELEIFADNTVRRAETCGCGHIHMYVLVLSTFCIDVMHVAHTHCFYSHASPQAPRFLTSTCLIDFDTIAGGDKFGNLFISRLPTEVSVEMEKDPAGSASKNKYGKLLHGAAHKVRRVTHVT